MAHVYDYITELCGQQAKVIHNHLSEIFAAQDKAKPDIAAVKLTRVQVTKLQL
jgi:hypothetical protein